VIRLGAYGLLGAVVRIRSSAPLARHLAGALVDLSCADRRRAPMLTVEAFRESGWSVSWPNEQRYEGPDQDVAFYDVLGALNEAAAQHVSVTGRVGLHGGAVRIGATGVAVVGHSGTGKSTLTAGLVQAGHGYIADELAAVSLLGTHSADPAGGASVHPFHRPIGLRSGGLKALDLACSGGPFEFTFPLVASTIGRLVEAAPLGLVVFVDRNPLAPPQTSPLRPAHALHRLSNNTLGTCGMEREIFSKLEQLVRKVPAVVVRYGTIEQGVRLIELAVAGLASE
jgi:hypothetical protein